MRKIKLFLTALAVMVASTAFAQKLTVTGNVTDASNGEPVPFASVHEKGTMNGVNTDVNGQYSITVSKDAVLVFSSIGYNAVEIAVQGKAQVNCDLPVDSETLDDAVVVGYGSAKKVGTIIGSVTTVKSENLKNAPSASALDALQGQVAGLAVLTTGGVSGDNNVSMTLHGMGSIGASSTPLYIIDGVQTDGRAIMAMNPNDILNITILKDASATSIYGSRAANGVVYVTTKAGSYNSKATVTLRSQAGISTLADFTLYDNMMSGDELKDFWVRSGLMTPAQVEANYTSKGYTANTKWYEHLMQLNNPQYQNDVTVEGGGEKVAYMVGASQFHQRGTTYGNFYDRYTVRSNVQGRPKNWLKVGANVSLSYDKRASNGNWGGSGLTDSPYLSGGVSFMLNPLHPTIDPATGKEYDKKYPNDIYNQIYYIESSNSMVHRYGLMGSFSVEIEPIKNLKIVSRAGLDGNVQYSAGTGKPSSLLYAGSGARSRSTALSYGATITNTIEYSFDIANNHHFVLLAGHEGVNNFYDAFSASSSGHTDDRMMNLQQGLQTKYSVSESFSQSKFLSFFGRIDYSLMDKYYFDASFRNDASSRFGRNFRNAQFWAVGGMWKIKREGFMSDVMWVTDLNLKASYGTQGNASLGSDYGHYGLVGSMSKYGDKPATGVGQPENPNLTWENQALLTVGLNGRLFDRLDVNVEFYQRTTSSMLMEVPYSYTTGFSGMTTNVGSLTNTGVDLTLAVDILRGRDYFLRASTTFNYNSEKITELFNGMERWEIANTGLAYVVGKPVSFYAPIFAGIDPEDGCQMWYLPGEDKDVTTMDPERVTKQFDETTLTQNIGKRLNAPINGGFSIMGGWRGIMLQADFSYVLGKTLLNNDMIFYANPASNLGYNTHKMVQDFWTPDNTDAKFPDWSKGQTMEFDTHLYENADFLRLKNLQIAYDLPRRFLGNQKVLNGLKVSFTGRNLMTLTKFTGVDPEVHGNLTYGRVGASKQYLFGLELTF